MLQEPDSTFIQQVHRRNTGENEQQSRGRGRVADRPQLSVGFVLMPKFTMMALAGFIEALRHAADVDDRSRQIQCAWSIIGPNHRPVESSCGISVAPGVTFEESLRWDYIAVVGGLLSGHESDPLKMRYLRAAAESGTPLIGLCTGSFVLARAGLMDGRRCCVSYYHVEDFQTEFGSRNIDVVADTLFVLDGPRITCAGGLGAVDLAIHLLGRHLGSHRSQKSVAQMLLSGVRPATAPQPQFNKAWYSSVRNPIVRRAILLMELHFNVPIPISSVAERLCISVKQLERLFDSDVAMSPASFYRKMRLDAARFMLGEFDRSITSVALDCGFSDISHFGRLFRSAFGVSPRDYRRGQYGASAQLSKGSIQSVDA
jgi:transcriptional regulator GlxA family with amidase domain